MAEGILSLICVALLWGVTNPLMGKGSSGIQKVKHQNFLVQFGSELKFLLLNWKVSLLNVLFFQSMSLLVKKVISLGHYCCLTALA